MIRLTDLTGYEEAHRHFSKAGLWELFDGDRAAFNIGHECVDRHPAGRVAVRVAFAEGGDEAYTFGELREGSNRFAAWLRKKGIAKGVRVAIMLEPSFLFYAALFGAMKAGCIAVPLFTLFGPEGLKLRLRDCTPRLLLAAPGHALLDSHAALASQVEVPGVVEVAEVVCGDAGFIGSLPEADVDFRPETSAEDPAMFQYTSGTTRERPEAVRHSHKALVTVMIAALYGTGIRPGDRFMCPSSPAWGHGLWHGTLAPLALGIETAAYAGPFRPERLLKALRDYRITNLSAAATHYRMMMKAANAGAQGLEVEKLSFTGEPMDSATAEWAGRAFGREVCSMYGTTEVGVMLAQYPGAPDFEVVRGALGKPVPGVELEIQDDAGRPCPPGIVGHLMVRRRDGWFATKDRAHRDARGVYYHDGRADDVIISAGWTMSPVEIEDVLLKHPQVAEAAVIGVPDPDKGQVAMAFIVPRPPGTQPDCEELQRFVKTQLSRHEYPREIAIVDSLPKTQAGKINRKALREAERAGLVEKTDSLEQTGAAEQKGAAERP
ncbi:MAG: acyl-CoA synthetase [bacterium]